MSELFAQKASLCVFPESVVFETGLDGGVWGVWIDEGLVLGGKAGILSGT